VGVPDSDKKPLRAFAVQSFFSNRPCLHPAQRGYRSRRQERKEGIGWPTAPALPAGHETLVRIVPSANALPVGVPDSDKKTPSRP